MKFLTVPRLQKLSAMMQAVDVGDRIIHCRLEAYSCKLAGTDKRAAKEINSALEASLSHAASHYSHASSSQASALGDLTEPATKHLLVSLITTLNASFPDYDFSNLRPDEFQREIAPQVAINSIDSLFLTAVGSSLAVSGFRTELWSALEETVQLHECEIYKYEPSEESDLNLGKLWTVNYFFFNRKQKKMLLLTAEAVSKLHLQNTASAAYQQMHGARRRATRMEAAGEEYDESEDAMNASGDAGDDEDDAAMLDNEQAMLDELAAENGEGGNDVQEGNALVDVGLLEWDLPLDVLQQQPQHHQQQFHSPDFRPSGVHYDSSPSNSSTSSAATVRILPRLPEAASAANAQMRLASTRTPAARAKQSPALQPTASSNLAPPQGLSLFGGSASSGFQPVAHSAHSALPAVPLFSQHQ